MNITRKSYRLFILLFLFFANGLLNPSSADTTGIPHARYDPCQATRQLFTINLSNPIVIPTGTLLPFGTGYSKTPVSEHQINSYDFWFLVRKCSDDLCQSLSFTYALPYSITFGDGKTYTVSGIPFNYDIIRGTKIGMIPVGIDTSPFDITGLRLIVSEPGTYAVYFFVPYSESNQTEPTNYYERMIITINQRDDFSTCYSPANDGYFRADLNEIDASSYPSSLKFKHIEGEEESWVENHSKQYLNFRLDDEWTNLPKSIGISDLNCVFEALSDAGNPEDGQCSPDNIVVPSYTRVTINGGTLALNEDPQSGGGYQIAYARRETDNITHLFLSLEDSQNALREEPVVHALPEDEIGAYLERSDGTREYLIFQTYDICMQFLGSEELCSSNQHCYHK